MLAYCVRCREKREMDEPKRTFTMKNGKRIIEGACPVCGTRVFVNDPSQEPAEQDMQKNKVY